MPDFTPGHLQSDANAVINIMGGIGQMVGFVIGTLAALLCGIFGFTTLQSALQAKTNANGQVLDEAGNVVLDAAGNPTYVNYTPIFLLVSVIALLCLVVLTVFYKKNKEYDLSAKVELEAEGEPAKKIKIKDLPLSKEERTSLLVMLAALFLINNATEAIIPNFTNFANKTLHVQPIYSTLMMAVFAVSLALFGIPAGALGRKIGRKKTIVGGLIVIIGVFLLYLLVSQLVPMKPDGSVSTFTWIVLWIALVVGGAAVGAININTLPLVLAIGGREYVGTFTGYYYTATFSAAVTGPILCGLIIGLFKEDYNFMFLFCGIFFALGLLAMLGVKHGEVNKGEDTEWLEEAVAAASDE
jgi:MFS family permease